MRDIHCCIFVVKIEVKHQNIVVTFVPRFRQNVLYFWSLDQFEVTDVKLCGSCNVRGQLAAFQRTENVILSRHGFDPQSRLYFCDNQGPKWKVPSL